MKHADRKKGRTGRKGVLYFLIFALGWFTLMAAEAGAQLIPHVSPNPVGSGARALGMGGAFIGIADDATAASWNPGGLIQLERPEMSVVGSVQMGREIFDSKEIPDLAGTNYLNRGDLNYFSVAYPFAIKRRNFVVSLNYQYLYDLNGSLNFGVTRNTAPLFLREKDTFRQRGGLFTISPALAVEILPNLSLGATLNIWPKDQGWESRFQSRATGAVVVPPIIIPQRIRTFQRDRFTWENALNGNVGLLWDINQYVTLGLVYKFPVKVPVVHKQKFGSSTNFGRFFPVETRQRLSLHMPPSYGLGVAVRFSDNFTMDLDVYRTEWRQAYFSEKKAVHGPKERVKTSFVNGLEMGQGKHAGKFKANIDPTHQVRLGAEYLFIFEKTVVPLRAGWFYDPAPSSFQVDKYYGVSIGTGISLGKLILDGAYQYRFGNGVAKDVFGAELKGTKASIGQHILLFSAIYHF